MKTAILLLILIFALFLDEHYARTTVQTTSSEATTPPGPECYVADNCKRCDSPWICGECKNGFDKVKIYSSVKCQCPTGTHKVHNNATKEDTCEQMQATNNTTGSECYVADNCKRCDSPWICGECNNGFDKVKIYSSVKCQCPTGTHKVHNNATKEDTCEQATNNTSTVPTTEPVQEGSGEEPTTQPEPELEPTSPTHVALDDD